MAGFRQSLQATCRHSSTKMILSYSSSLNCFLHFTHWRQVSGGGILSIISIIMIWSAYSEAWICPFFTSSFSSSMKPRPPPYFFTSCFSSSWSLSKLKLPILSAGFSSFVLSRLFSALPFYSLVSSSSKIAATLSSVWRLSAVENSGFLESAKSTSSYSQTGPYFSCIFWHLLRCAVRFGPHAEIFWEQAQIKIAFRPIPTLPVLPVDASL